MITKECSRCKKYKKIINFCKQTRSKDGHSYWCRKCISEYGEKNREKTKKARKEYRFKNRNKIKKDANNYYKKNKIKKLEYYNKNKDKIRRYQREWRKNNRDKINEYCREKYKENIKDTKYKMKCSIRRIILLRLKSRLLSKNYRSTFTFLPYTVDDLIINLESKFKKGMTWRNHGKWHIDHIKPDSLFNYKSVDDKEFQECWSLSNLQPLWASENLSKGNRYF